MKNSALIGAIGYIARGDMKANKDACNQLFISRDPNDSAGFIDGGVLDVGRFTEFECFDRHMDKMRGKHAFFDAGAVLNKDVPPWGKCMATYTAASAFYQLMASRARCLEVM